MRNALRKINTLEFFDGETINNKYMLLGNSNDYIFNKKGLGCLECLDYLYNTAQNYNYFFRIDYDLNMIFSKENLSIKKTFREKDTNKEIELSLITALFSGYEVEFYGYTIEYFRHKVLNLRKDKKAKKFYDVSNFFNTSFIKTLKILEIELTDKEKNILTEYKEKRNIFNIKEITNIIEYNKIECILGLKIVNKIYSLLPDYLQTFKLYGSSALAHKFLTDKGIDKKNFFTNKALNGKIFESAYFGGRMESLKIGNYKNVWKYDINSAYPNIIKELREVKKIDYVEKFKNKKIIDTNLYYIEMNIKDLELPGLLPYRLKSGYLVFPANVKGWYYGIEVKNVIEYQKYYDIDLEIISEIKITLGEKIFPENEIEEIYSIRQQLKELKDLRNYIYKILLNSMYGKLAQQTGAKKFLNFYYAGLITSFTRAKLIEVIKDNPKSVIFFATDGILTEKRIKNIPISFNLGDFEEIKIKDSYTIMSGVYKCIDSENKVIYAERGFRTDLEKVIIDIKQKYYSEIEQNIFIGNKYFEKNYKAYKDNRCKFTTLKKVIDIRNQIKRFFTTFEIENKNNSRLMYLSELDKINKIPLNTEEIAELVLLNDNGIFDL